MSVDREHYPLRAPCSCGHTFGRIVEKSGQDTVRCIACDRHCYNAPRGETGREVRNVSKRDGIKPSVRARILERDGYRCVLCRAPAEGTADFGKIMHVGHIISIESGLRLGMSEDELNDEENLAAMCEECNLGIGPSPLPLRTAIAIVRARIS